MEIVKAIVENKHETAASLALENKIPNDGEWFLESDTLKGKVGDGVTQYNSLDYSIDIPSIIANTAGVAANVIDIAAKPTGTTDQLCKAWVNFDGTGTVAIRDSFNVSSITDNGTGDYAVNLTSALSSANGSACAWGMRNAGETAIQSAGRIVTSSTVEVLMGNDVNTLFDAPDVYVLVFGS